MKKNKQTNALRTVLSSLNYGLLAVCMVLGFGISEIQAQFVSPANFYNQVDGVLTNEVDVAPGDTINYLIGVNSEGGIDGVTITMNFDPALMQIQDGDVIDEVGPLFNFPVDEDVINPDGYFTFSKALIGSFYQGSTPFISINLIISDAITQSTTTTIDHILDDAVILRSQIALYGNALLADADAPSLTINILVPADCPALGLNIGDACDDGNPLTADDTVTDNCECVGTPVFVCEADGGSIEFGDGTTAVTVCVDDNIASNVDVAFSVEPTAPVGYSGTWVVTDLDLNLLGLPATMADVENINFDDAGAGNCLIWFLSFDADNSNADEAAASFLNGDAVNAGDLTGCFDLSNAIEVIRENCSPVFDCPILQANIGDACDDGNANTANDMVNDNCECMGTVIFDCPTLQANIGDACDDGDSNTINDMVDANCDCAGTPDPALFCTNLGLFIGDACDDGDDATTNDMVTANCECQGTVAPDCQDWSYYLADHAAADGISDIYEVTLGGANAVMTYLTTSEIEVHIAFNEDDNLIYAVSKHENSYRTYDPALDVWGPAVDLGADYGEITTAVFNADGKLLIGSQDLNAIYSVNIATNVVSPYDTFSPIYGGDIAFASDGMLFLATRSGNGLYENYPAPANDMLIGSVPNLVTGLAITDADQLVVSAQGNTSLALYNYNGSAAGSFDLSLNGVPYTLRDGDMASGCNTSNLQETCDDFTTFYVDHDPSFSGSNLYTVDYSGTDANLTFVTSVDFEAHISFNAANNILYFVNANGSFVRFYDVTNDVFLGDLPLSGAFTKITAVIYNPADGLLYIGDDITSAVSTIDLTTGDDTFFANAPVSGGDLAVLDNGDIYLATRAGASLYQVIEAGAPILIGSIPATVTGMSRANDATSVILSNRGADVFTRVLTADASIVTTYNVMLSGSPFTLSNGDMAAGCADPIAPKPGFSTIEAEVNSELTSFPNPTTGQSNVVFTTAETGRTLVEVYDMSGRNVATLFNAEAQQNKEYRLDFDGAALPNGVYIYRLTTQNETIVEKFMIAK